MIYHEEMVSGSLAPEMNTHVWQPEDACCGTVYIVHGLGEHGYRYRRLASHLTAHGLAVCAPDLPGHGKTPGERGHIASLLDAAAAVADLPGKGTTTKTPCFLFGHSMGGTAVLSYLARGPSEAFDGFIASSPFFRASSPPSIMRAAVVKALRKLAPTVSVGNGLNASHLSRLPSVVWEYTQDPCVHDRVSVQLASNLLETGASILKQGLQTDRNLLVLQGASDRICSNRYARRFVERSSHNIQYEEFAGAYHELHNDASSTQHCLAVAEWISVCERNRSHCRC